MQAPDARTLAQEYARERGALKKERQRRDATQERDALYKQVPDILPQKYSIIRKTESGREMSCYTSDRLEMLFANAGVALDTVKRMINTGETVKVFSGYIKIVPEGTE